VLHWPAGIQSPSRGGFVSYPYQPPPQYPEQHAHAYSEQYGEQRYPQAYAAASPAAPFGYPPIAPRPSSRLPAYASSALFAACGFLTLFLGVLGWGGTHSPHVNVSLVGVLYTERVTGNSDFGISMTMTVACTTLTFALVSMARLAIMRWILAGLGGLVAAYYACALLFLMVHGAIQFVPLPVFAFMLWSAATAVSLLPATARAMRSPGWLAALLRG
jgi:hypothetical protein